MKPFVCHFCRNKKCNNAFLALDDNNAQSRPPQNKYCYDCRVFEGMQAKKDPAKVARGHMLAAMAREKKNKYAELEGL